jgi:hypothetical protein
MKKQIFFILFLLISFSTTYAQNRTQTAQDSLKNIPDSLKKALKYKKPFKFTVEGIRFGFDVLYPIYDNFVVPPDKNALDPDKQFEMIYSAKQRLEGSIDVGFAQNRFFAVLDYGISSIDRRRKGLAYTAFTYKNVGSYFRIGADYNFMHRNFKEEAMFVGFRYARAYFSHDFEYFGANEAWNYSPRRLIESTAQIVDERYYGSISESNLSATWFEIVTGLRVNVWKQFYMGYTARVMIRSAVQGEDILKANELPGFGSTNRTARLIFNYYIYYRIPFLSNKKIKATKKENK